MRRAAKRHRIAMPTLLLLAGLLAAIHPTPVDAQRRGPETVTSGDEVRVRLRSGGELRGDLIGLNDAGLVLDADVRRRLSAGEVDRLWIRHDRTRSFAIGGAVAGGVLTGGFFGLLIHAVCETDSCASDTVKATLAGGAVGALGGTVVGALFGTLASGWEEVDPGFGTAAPERSRAVDLAIAPTFGESGPGLALGLSLPAPR